MNIPKYLKFKLNNISMKNKLLVSFMLAVLMPTLIVGTLLTGGMRNMALEQATNSASQDVDQVEKRLQEVIKLATDVSNTILLNDNIMYILNNNYKEDTLGVFLDYMNNKILDENLMLHPNELHDIRLYSFNDTLLNNSRFIPVTDEMRAYPWFNKTIDGKGVILWDYNFNEFEKKSHLSMTRLMKDRAGKPLGILLIEINDDYLDLFLADEQFDVIISDDKDNILAAKDLGLKGSKSSTLKIDRNANNNSIVYNGKPSYAVQRTIRIQNSKSSFRIISIFNINTLMLKARGTVNLGLLIITGSLLFSLVLITFFSNALSKRLKRLSNDIHIVTSGKFDIPVAIEGNDEVGRLSKDLQYMIKSINELIHEVYEVNLQKNQLDIKQKEIKLRMLANQINPHFLFNVLETVKSKAKSAGTYEIVEIMKQLGKILRSNLEIESESILLTKELELVKSYLEIQKYRFGNKINYTINVEDNINEYRVLPMLMQPIVENSVVHGLENKLGPGVICINVKRCGGMLRISVSDNGVGMDEKRLKVVLESLKEQEYDPNRRIGLRNVYQRIKLYYGEKYDLEIYSSINSGTEIIILLPEGDQPNDEAINS